MTLQAKQTLTLQVAGRRYRVTTTASEEEVRRLANVVDLKTQELFRGRPLNADALVLTAISLAHEAEASKRASEDFRTRLRAQLGALLEEIDDALAQLSGAGGGPGGRPES